eukprot:GDKI01028033.1.p1 GENE.GDKI01028033.1~~GDKI01028033.1.p1  ORF type:complete len:192 (-),score=37.29 GDKI01028033.1:25-600(-)
MGDAQALVDFYPSPPAFWTHFETPDAVAPPRPIEGNFMLYGLCYSTENKQEPLEAAFRMYEDAPGTDVRVEIRRLYAILVDEVMDFLKVAVHDTGGVESKGSKITKVMMNIQHILHRVRVCEARLLIRDTLKEQIASHRKQSAELRHVIEKLRGILAQANHTQHELPHAQQQTDGQVSPAVKKVKAEPLEE